MAISPRIFSADIFSSMRFARRSLHRIWICRIFASENGIGPAAPVISAADATACCCFRAALATVASDDRGLSASCATAAESAFVAETMTDDTLRITVFMSESPPSIGGDSGRTPVRARMRLSSASALPKYSCRSSSSLSLYMTLPQIKMHRRTS